MKKVMTLFLLILITLFAFPTTALSQSDSVLIYPWRVPVNEDGERIVTVYSDQEVLLGASWFAANRGLIKQFHSAVHLDWAYQGEPLFTSDKEVFQYWSPPTPSEGGYWGTLWEYSLGTLTTGDHSVSLHYWLDHPIIDGGDYDGDRAPDRFNGTVVEVEITIRVVDP